jgi:hypothetical protein
MNTRQITNTDIPGKTPLVSDFPDIPNVLLFSAALTRRKLGKVLRKQSLRKFDFFHFDFWRFGRFSLVLQFVVGFCSFQQNLSSPIFVDVRAGSSSFSDKTTIRFDDSSLIFSRANSFHRLKK